MQNISRAGVEANGSSIRFQRLLLALGSLALSVTFMVALVPGRLDAQHPGDNTSASEDQTGPTADQQKMDPSDRALTQKIRKAIHHDKSLSVYGRNIKIFTQRGKVTLRGPVQSEEEKGNLEAKAINAAGQENVSNQLKVAPSK